MLLAHFLCKISRFQDPVQGKEKEWRVDGDLVSGINPFGIISAWHAIPCNMTLHLSIGWYYCRITHLKSRPRLPKFTICPLKYTAEFGAGKFPQVPCKLCSGAANWLGSPNNFSEDTTWRPWTESEQCMALLYHFSHIKSSDLCYLQGPFWSNQHLTAATYFTGMRADFMSVVTCFEAHCSARGISNYYTEVVYLSIINSFPGHQINCQEFLKTPPYIV